MKILLLGSGGREHALAWKISQSPKVEKLYIAPGNAGTAGVGENVALKADDFEGIKQFVLANDVNMVVVGPEDPLVKGIYDYFKNLVDEINATLPSTHRVCKLTVRKEDFPRTGAMKVKRN